jgi:hypothetical protein
MNDWDAPVLVALAAAPGTAMLALAYAIFLRKRKIGAASAVLWGAGMALWIELFLSLAVHTIDTLYPLRNSLMALLGVPLFAYMVTLTWLAKRWRIKPFFILPGGFFGLIGLYYLGGVVLMSSVCSVSLGGC